MPPSFLQSSEWEGFERSLGRATRRVGDVLIVRRELPMGFRYWYCPRPTALTEDFFSGVKKNVAAERSVFLKIDPAEEAVRNGAGVPIYRDARAIQPSATIVLDFYDRTEDELLAAMHEKTRYNIRLAERKGVQVRKFTPTPNFGVGAGESGSMNQERDFKIFWALLDETAQRDGFRTHPRRYYEKLMETSSDDFSNELFFAEYDGEVLAAAMVNFYRPVSGVHSSGVPCATYLHGASSSGHREVMASHLLQWRIIQDAKKRGCGIYDFWGIDEQRWPGVTRFKRGFGGREIIYPQSVDIVYRPVVYAAYQIAKKVIS